MRWLIAGLTTQLLLACATDTPLVKETASGLAEESYDNVTSEEVRGQIMEACLNRGMPVTDSSTNHVICGHRMRGAEAFVAQLLIGNSYSTTPERRIRFTIFTVGDRVRVTAGAWMETQMAFGQMRRVELDHNTTRNNLQTFLASLPAYRNMPSLPSVAPDGQATKGATAAPDLAASPADRTARRETVQSFQQTQQLSESLRRPALGRDTAQAERLAVEAGCHDRPVVTMVTKGPGFEAYSATCRSGDVMMIRCEFGNCRDLR